MRYLRMDEILRLQIEIVEEYGGAHGIRDEGRLASVESAPKQEIFGAEQYPAIHEKAAVYMRNIIGDHPFSDGNKRTGTTTAAIFLMMNGFELTATPIDLEDFAVSVATEHLDIPTITAWLTTHSTKV